MTTTCSVSFDGTCGRNPYVILKKDGKQLKLTTFRGLDFPCSLGLERFSIHTRIGFRKNLQESLAESKPCFLVDIPCNQCIECIPSGNYSDSLLWKKKLMHRSKS